MAELMGVTYERGVTVEGYTVRSTSQMGYSAREVNPTPTLNDISSAFGMPGEVGEGFIGVLDPSGAHTSLWLCACNGVQWYYLPMTLAFD